MSEPKQATDRPRAGAVQHRDIKPTRTVEQWEGSESSDEENTTAAKNSQTKEKPKPAAKKDSKYKEKDNGDEGSLQKRSEKTQNQESHNSNRNPNTKDKEGGEYRFEKGQRRTRERREDRKDTRRQDQRRPREDQGNKDKRRQQRERDLQDYEISFEEDFGGNFANWLVVKDDRIGDYVKKAEKLLKEHKFISIKAANYRIEDAILIAEEVAKSIKKLQRINIPGTIEVREVWHPRRKDLKEKVTKRLQPQITIELSTSDLTKKHIGYQSYSEVPVNQDYDRNRKRNRRANNEGKGDRDNRGSRDNRSGRDNPKNPPATHDDREYR